jgi:hypothetical protein
MKTWIFTEDLLEEEIDKWVKAQKATGHPKAMRNADFIAKAILDFLENANSLIKEFPRTQDQANYKRSEEAASNKIDTQPKHTESNRTLSHPLEGIEPNGLSPTEMLEVWEKCR